MTGAALLGIAGHPLRFGALCGICIGGDGRRVDLDRSIHHGLVRRPIAGHQPQGQCPGVVRCGGSGAQLTLLVADTSYLPPCSTESGVMGSFCAPAGDFPKRR